MRRTRSGAQSFPKEVSPDGYFRAHDDGGEAANISVDGTNGCLLHLTAMLPATPRIIL
eukprot:CAMPEP_0181239044 /NCGR_PEP_ID=MMETSP1096-20121128/39704_1 /TAXON_ID=156174 ORGANISM="Chrysochromulina ericina, Strain CCMP281" /NCGR_SAMPLE_ID=MMETSP1096 /ASSEMBLY_ACC=CAM_ASM_000453 /LENGTH=57 /DNA_ID=CAMNT_0023334675 /DNA_START=301 /DNA_END=474 /DNA_ORIENTATION=+